MREEEKQAYLEKYKKDKEKGVPFFPDILFKDALAALLVFVVLLALVYLVGAPLEERANPADTSYTPRPEWYFLFLFQLLKYFPGNLEVVGVVLIPTLAILLLFALPLIDKHRLRHFTKRPYVTGITALVFAGVIYLTVQAYQEAPPPAEVTEGDKTASLYIKNCAGCHGPSISVSPQINLHAVIAEGRHEGMPSWSADLSTDQIDALAGFILSPSGSKLFSQNCAECHEAAGLVASDPFELKKALEESKDYPAHSNLTIQDWNEVLNPVERKDLLNFLIAPDGQRLFVTNCSSCHGSAVSFSGTEIELRTIISQGGLHLEMPPWRQTLNNQELETLAQYVVDPTSAQNSASTFEQYCSDCHGERIPSAEDVETAKQMIEGGGAHQTMPVWGEILTAEQLDALVNYTYQAAKGTPLEVGQQLYSQNCSSCHGDFGEGGPNPARQGDIIAPISTSEFLTTRDDFTLRAIISQGQPNFGMAPFGSTSGGPLDEEQIDAIVAYMRSWEENPPVELPPQIILEQVTLSGSDIYTNLCAQCHGVNGEGGLGPSLRASEFQQNNSDEEIFDTINIGHAATSMIAWGEILTANQIQQLVEFIRQLSPTAELTSEPPPAAEVSFNQDILPIFEQKCAACHGTFGGWDASSYDATMTTGNNAPVVIPGDPENSLLAQKLLGTHTEGAIMPPGGKLPDDEIQIVLDWISNGALDN